MKRFFLFTLGLIVSITLTGQQVPRDKVVVEIATGTWCTYCPGAAMGADDLVANGCQVAVIENHNGDPFANTASNARNAYYAVSGYPTAKFDGVLTKVGGSHTQSMYSQYLPLYNTRIAIPSSFTLTMNGSNTGLDYNVTIVAEKVATYSGTNLVLQLALTQSEIAYNWQGQTELNFVNRLMAPTHNGTPLNFTSESSQIVDLTFTRNSSWPEDHCELVAFIQNNSTKEIVQGIKVALPDLQPAYTTDAGLIEIKNLPVSSCSGAASPTVVMRNGGSSNLVSADIMYSVNNSPLSSYSWSGSLGYAESVSIDLPEINFSVETVNNFKAYVTNPNGGSDQNPMNDTINGNFNQAGETTSVLYLELMTDNNPEEISWDLSDAYGNVLYSGGPYTGMPNTLIQETFAMSNEECYVFSLYDDGGNGICCNNGNGYYKLTDYFGTEFYSGGEFADKEVVEFYVSGMILDLKVFLEGPYNGVEMYRFLNTYGFLPLSQPYSGAPWNYNGTESVASIPNINIVEWVLIELRETAGGPETATSGTIISRRAAFLLKNGKVVDVDGVSPLAYDLNITDNLYVVVRHRNHIGVMSANALTPFGRVYQYDFSTDATQAYGGVIAHRNMGNGVWGMTSGDGNSDSQVGNGDKIDVWSPQAGNSGYVQGDFDLNANVNNQDKVDSWGPNSGLGGQIPQ